jgi:hypothetical protein
MKNIIFCSFLLLSLHCFAQKQDNLIIVKPKEIDDVLTNPGIGFTTFQMFNGDNHKPNQDVVREINLGQYNNPIEIRENNNYPETTIAYFRINWSVIEPERGKYRWDYIDSLLELAHAHDQTLMLRISPYKGRPIDDVPAWYREMVGPEREFQHVKWPVDPENPLYAESFGNMIRALGERYDGNPDLEAVDLAIIGWAGEGGGSELLSQKTREVLIDAYTDSFRETPLIALLMDPATNMYARDQIQMGWRIDCIGDLGFWADEQNGWTHMYDFYPREIINCNVQNDWKTSPLSFEICGDFNNWKNAQGYSREQVNYIFDQSLKWHISSFNAKSAPVPEEWQDLVDDWLKKMGYRFVLRRFTFPSQIQQNGKLEFTSWWENKGVAPCYKDFAFAIRLKNDSDERIFITNADIRTWLPGDNVYDNHVFIPLDMNPGTYNLQVGIVDAVKGEPKVKLAIEGIDNEDWYTLNKIEVVE